MLGWLKGVRNSPEVFRWSSERGSRFTEGFRTDKSSRARQLTLTIAVTQVCAERSSWNMELEHKVFGWAFENHNAFWMRGMGGIPVQLNVGQNGVPYTERSSREPE